MISLAGQWDFQMGYENAEPSEVPFQDKIQIPGILQAQGYGDDISTETPWVSSLHDPLWFLREEYKEGQRDGISIPFLSQPPKHYLGAAWYKREIEVEEGYYDFEIECTKWKTEVYLDGNFSGRVVSLCAPHRFFLGWLSAGKHVLAVKVDNRMQYPYRPDGHGVSDALAASWNGMTGNVALERIPALSVQEMVLKPDTETMVVRTELLFSNRTQQAMEAELEIAVTDARSGRRKSAVWQAVLPAGEERRSFSLDCEDNGSLWDEYDPAVLMLTVRLCSPCGEQTKELMFGFRHVCTRDGRFYLNHRPAYLRGTHFGGDFPLLGYPSDKREDWERIFGICREWGLNFVRFHSFCPPEAAFAAADRVGIYLQVECAMWDVFQEGNGMEEVLWAETERILQSFGHHPSFLLLSPTNEPGGEWAPVLARWYRRCKEQEKAFSGQRIYTSQSGWPYPVKPSEIRDNDYVYFHRSGYGPFMGGTIRNRAGWADRDYRSSLEGIRYPVITHEMGQWCSYPDFDIMKKFTGYLRPGNYKVFRESARAAGVLAQNKEFVRASGKLQVQMYKEDLEANFRTPHIYGYELLDLHDYLGQGSALVGLLDAFWDNKGYTAPEEFRHFCDGTVLLLRIGKRVYTEEETLSCNAELSHFGKEPFRDAQVTWQLLDSSGEAVREGSFEKKDYALAKNQAIGTIDVAFAGLDAPACYTIRLAMRTRDSKGRETEYSNCWRIWLYSRKAELPRLTRAVYTRELSEALEALSEGKRVVYAPRLSVLDFSCPYLSERPSFWNSQMGPKWSRGMGLLCQSSHPALRFFPTEDYQEYQWNEILRDAKGFHLFGLPEELRPIVQPIDEWNRNYRMGLVLEARVGPGSLLLVTFDPDKDKEACPAKRQLMRSLLLYADSDEFRPKVSVRKEELLLRFADTRVMRRLGVKGTVAGYPEADLSEALDGSPDTAFILHGEGYPYTIELSWEREETVTGFVYMPVQNDREHEGDIRDYEIECFDGEQWILAAKGEFPSSYEPKKIEFDREIISDRLRFTAKSGFGGEKIQWYEMTQDGWFRKEGPYEDKTLSAAEFALLTKDGVFAAGAEGEGRRREAKTATKEIEE